MPVRELLKNIDNHVEIFFSIAVTMNLIYMLRDDVKYLNRVDDQPLSFPILLILVILVPSISVIFNLTESHLILLLLLCCGLLVVSGMRLGCQASSTNHVTMSYL